MLYLRYHRVTTSHFLLEVYVKTHLFLSRVLEAIEPYLDGFHVATMASRA
jgi:hypothetical protein